MAKGAKTGGRKKGTPNRTTIAVKDALIGAFENLGGVPSLVTWAEDNPTEFYKLWAKILPQEVSANLSANVNLTGGVSIYLPDNGRDKPG